MVSTIVERRSIITSSSVTVVLSSMSLQTVLRGPSYPLIIFQSSAAQSSLAILGSLLRKTSMHIIICSLLYSTGFLIGEPAQDRIQEVDCTTDIPGYEDDPLGCRERLFSAIHSGI